MKEKDSTTTLEWEMENIMDISQNELEFVTFCIEILRESKEISSQDSYRLLTEETTIMDDFLIPNYEILHSQSKKYILDEILKLLEEDDVC